MMNLLRPSYRLQIGSITIEPSTEPDAGPVRIMVDLNMDMPADQCEVVLGHIPDAKYEKGENISVDLGYEDSLSLVFTGKVDSVAPSITTIKIKGLCDATKLLALRIDKTYEKQKAGAIVSDVCSQAGVTVGETQGGIEFPAFVIDSQKIGYDHIRDLAEKCGFDVYFTPDNKLVFKEFAKSSADHTVEYGKDLINVEFAQREQPVKKVAVFGESPVGSKGEKTWHWLTKSFESFKGEAGSGKSVLIEDSSIKNKDAAATRAQARLEALNRRMLTGAAVVLGKPEIKLGDAMEVVNMPEVPSNGVLKVCSISHQLSKEKGFITSVFFTKAKGN